VIFIKALFKENMQSGTYMGLAYAMGSPLTMEKNQREISL
jgi:hypothetical protein